MRIATRELLNDLVEILGDAFAKVAVDMGFEAEEAQDSRGKIMNAYEELMAGYDDVYVEETPSFKHPVPHYKRMQLMPGQKHFPKIKATARSTC